MNVAEQMRKCLEDLRRGFDCVSFPDLEPESEHEWTENYAIVQGLCMEGIPHTFYFDIDEFRIDFERYVNSMFPGCNVKFYWKSQEIEVVKHANEPTLVDSLASQNG